VAAPLEPAFEELLAFLRDERAFDFTGYKRASLERRVRRRMEALGIESYEDYHDYLQVHQDEFTALFNTILINVTSFFRDPDAWRYLSETLLPDLLRHREGHQLRIWSAGCASGEEAYTLAMVFAEQMGVEEFRERVKIYATDVDEEALTHARHATYGARDLSGVPEELREKYFEPAGARFVFRKELRRSVIFGRNDIVQDAPISHVDVLACRNTLMYFNAETQAQVLNRMHFALRPDGILFLGKAEMLLSHSSYFRAIELKRRFFRKVATEPRDRRPVLPAGNGNANGDADLDVLRLRYAALMQSPAAQIALDLEGRLAVCNSKATHMFGLSPRDIGRPIQDLEMSYRPTELRTHIDEALADRRSIWIRDVTLLRGAGEQLSLDIQFLPLSDDAGNPLGITVIFNDVTQYRQLQHDLQYANRQLETAYEELQSTNEELETTNEELQSTVEELETTNEELQSTNEELETMNEELQSMNDELQFSNEALRDRQDELDRLNDFMSSVLGSMNSGVAVVDSDMRVLAWNARAEDLWGVRADEAVGSHLLNLDIGLPLDALRNPIRAQLSEEPPEPSTSLLSAVNRRGRPVEIRVTLTHLSEADSSAPAAMLVMEVVDKAGGRDDTPPEKDQKAKQKG
jgi:two-component system, chemotaxis family, CheB/CheR fusion protein